MDKIFNVNKGVCQARLQQGNAKPYFVNWQCGEENFYSFFYFPHQMYEKFDKLKSEEREGQKTATITNGQFAHILRVDGT